MRRNRLLCRLALLLATPAAAAWLSTAQAAERSFLEDEVLEVLRDVQDGELAPAAARDRCLLTTGESEDAESLRQVMSTFLEVSGSQAIPAFCSALIDAVAERRLAAEELAALIDGGNHEAEAYAVGRLLREVYMTHNGLLATPVDGGGRP